MKWTGEHDGAGAVWLDAMPLSPWALPYVL